MTYMYFSPNGWCNRHTALDKADEAMNKIRREMHGPNWYNLDLWGRPVPERQPSPPSNYRGKRFVEGMARSIARGVSI